MKNEFILIEEGKTEEMNGKLFVLRSAASIEEIRKEKQKIIDSRVNVPEHLKNFLGTTTKAKEHKKLKIYQRIE